jgi:phosphomevalonate kinase
MMAFIYERREETEHDEFFNIIRDSIDDKSQRKEADEMGKTMLQVLRERGEAIGKITTKQEDIIKLIRLKFESVPENFIKNIQSITQIEQLDTIFERAVIAKTIKDLEF